MVIRYVIVHVCATPCVCVHAFCAILDVHVFVCMCGIGPVYVLCRSLHMCAQSHMRVPL